MEVSSGKDGLMNQGERNIHFFGSSVKSGFMSDYDGSGETGSGTGNGIRERKMWNKVCKFVSEKYAQKWNLSEKSEAKLVRGKWEIK